jgi:hypothetical protein
VALHYRFGIDVAAIGGFAFWDGFQLFSFSTGTYAFGADSWDTELGASPWTAFTAELTTESG